MSDIPNCPCCGGEATEIDDPYALGVLWSVRCVDCGLETAQFRAKAGAIAAWSKRADGWVSVEDRLPENTKYWCYEVWHDKAEYLWEKREINCRWDGETFRCDDDLPIEKVTHWRLQTEGPSA